MSISAVVQLACPVVKPARRAGLKLAAWAGVAALGIPSPAWAQAPTDTARADARDYFERGLRRFNQLDNEGALLDFKQAYALAPHAQVLKNIGLVYAAMNRPIQAVEVFDLLLAAPAGLDHQSIERIASERQLQLRQIAEVEIKTNVIAADGLVEVDGIESGRLPLRSPLRVAKGIHIVSVVATGYIPMRRQVDLVETARTTILFDLVPSDAALAHLEIYTKTPGIDLYLNGELVGKTPLATSLAVAPGHIHLTARRAGYREFTSDLELGPGTHGRITVALQVAPEGLSAMGGFLALHISEPDAIVFIDGESYGPYSTPLRLVAGSHTLRVEHAESFPADRAIFVVAHGTAEYEVELEPTPQKLERYQSGVRRRNTLGWVTVATGGVLTAASIGFLALNSDAKSKRKAEFDTQVARADPGGDCDPTGLQVSTCRTELSLALKNLEQTRNRDVYGWIGLGIGGASLGVGLWLLLGNDDPKRYSPISKKHSIALRRITSVPVLSRDVVGASVSWTF